MRAGRFPLPALPFAPCLLLLAGMTVFGLRASAQTGARSAAELADLIAAVKAKDGPSTSRLLKAGADPRGRDANGLTPLHCAAGGGDITTAMLLIAAGAELDAQDPAGLTPLHFAARAGSLPVANLLIVSGADPRVTSRAGLSPSAEAAKNHQEKVAEFLREREALPAARTAPPAAPSAPAAPASSAPRTWPEESGPLSKPARDQLQRAFDAGDWTDNIEAAQQFSKEKRVATLALFTGSDWCHFFKVLDAQVLSTSAFRSAVKGKYVLLYVDFPRSNKPSKEVQQQRNRFAEKYGVHSFPTLLVLERGDRELYRIRGFSNGTTAESYIANIQSIAR